METGIEIKENAITIQAWWNTFSYKGEIERDAEGSILNELVGTTEGSNLIVTTGKGLLLDRLSGNSVLPLSRIGAGTNGTAVVIGDTALTGAVYKAFDFTPVRSGLTTTYTATFGPNDANFLWKELGMDNIGTLFNRKAPIGVIEKTAELSIIVIVGLTQV